ncbi:MAG TPA: hypothetical protein PKH07_03870 [bacterium]|nr:hypothetical protein [bacterium]
MKDNGHEAFRQGTYALMWGLIMAGGTFLTLIAMSVYAQPRRDYIQVEDLAPLLTPAAPLDASVPETGPDLVVFSQRNIFEEIITPVPTATKVPKPSPSPTQRMPGLHWKLKMVAGNVCGIEDFQKQFKMLELGEEYQGARVKEINMDDQSVVIEDILDGNTRTLRMSAE